MSFLESVSENRGASFLNAYVTVARMDEPIELYFFGS